MTEPPRDYEVPPQPVKQERPPKAYVAYLILIVIAAAASLVALAVNSAEAHDWYPFACCSNQDCRPVAQSSISERPDGYHVAQNGDVLGYTDQRIRQSQDNEYHLCTVAGDDNARTICLFVPDRGS